jgi:hypothetical protein
MNLAETVKIARAGVLIQFQTVPVPERDFLLETTPPSTWAKMEILLHTSRGLSLLTDVLFNERM